MTRLPSFVLLALLGCAPAEVPRDNLTLPVSPTADGAGDLRAVASSSASSTVAAPSLSDDDRRALDSSDVIVVATLRGARIDAILEVAPPIFVHAFDVVVDRRLAGGATPARIHAKLSSRAHPDAFEDGEPVIVALHRVQATLPEPSEHWEATLVLPLDPAVEAELARTRSALPEGLSWSVAQIPPTTVIQWQNEYGDGNFELTLKNETNGAIEVRGLFSQDGQIHWTSALTVRDEAGLTHQLRGTARRPDATPVVLQPGATIRTVVDVKPFGIAEPAGGSRYHYSFGLGDLRTSSFFYYTHSLHGPQMGKTR